MQPTALSYIAGRWKEERQLPAMSKIKSPAMFPAVSVCQQDVCTGESISVSNKVKQQVGDLQCFFSIATKACPGNKTDQLFKTRVFKQECRIAARFCSWKSSALPTSWLFESAERTKPAFIASVDSAVPLSWDSSCSLFGSKAFLFCFCKGSVSISSSAPREQLVWDTPGRSRALCCPFSWFSASAGHAWRGLWHTGTAASLQKGSKGERTGREREECLPWWHCLEHTSYSSCPVLKLGKILSKDVFSSPN